jgi:dynein heavy chain 1
MGRIFVGLCQVGAWGCFDEFNRLEERMLSAVSQQIQSIQLALQAMGREGADPDDAWVELVGRRLRVHEDVGIFVTMNPGYAGRSNLPDNLKKLFRQLAMTKPDRQLIAQVMLFAQGFRTAEALSKKIVPLFTLCEEQLSAQSHYDFGLRATKGVLVTAGNVKRSRLQEIRDRKKSAGEAYTDEEVNSLVDESEVLVQSVTQSFVPKLVREDKPLLASLMQDVFPGVVCPDPSLELLKEKVREVAQERHLEIGPVWMEKLLQVFMVQEIAHGLMMVGPSGSGKSSAWTVLLEALNRLEAKGPDQTGVSYVIDPKAISKDELYGFLDQTTREWTDGLFTAILRKIIDNHRGELKRRQWIIFDGDVDPEWVENLNSVLDDNKLLTLPNGERLALPPNVKVMFEVKDLKYATLATVSRCGMIWFSEDAVTMDMCCANYLGLLRNQPLNKQEEMTLHDGKKSFASFELQNEVASVLAPHFVRDGLVSKALEECRCKGHIMEFTDVRALTSFFCILSKTTLKVVEYNQEHSDFPMDPAAMKNYVEKRLVYAIIWAFAGDCKLFERQQIGDYLRNICAIDFPSDASKSVIDFQVNLQGEWEPWSNHVPTIEVETHKVAATDVVVPTIDTVRHEDLLYTWLAENKPMVLCGPPGSGKTMTLFSALRVLPHFEVVGINFSSATGVDLIMKTLDQYCQYRKTPDGLTMSPVQHDKNLILFCDECNLPNLDKYGTAPVISFIRQLVEHNGFWRTSDHTWVTMERIQFVGACNPPTDPGRKPMTPRFLRHVPVIYVDYPGAESYKQIYGTFIRATLRKVPVLKGYSDQLTNCMVDFYMASQRRFTLDMQPHYIYSPREMTRWIKGINNAVQHVDTAEGLARLCAHEALRLFNDRLIFDEEREWTLEHLDNTIALHFSGIDKDKALERPILYSDWLSKDYLPVEQEQLRDYVKARLKVFYEEELDVQLVLFDDVLEHVLRIDRILKQNQGHMLLVGASGAGKTVLTRFVCWLNGLSVFQVKVHKRYTAEDFDEDLRGVMRRAGTEGEKIVFIMDEGNVVDTAFLERLNTLLANGECPGLFEADEFTTLMAQCKAGSLKTGHNLDSHDELYKWFNDQVMNNLHVVFTMNPSTEGLKDRASTSPALFNRCVLDWFGDWSDQALFQVGLEFTEKVDLDLGSYQAPSLFPATYTGLPQPPSHREAVVDSFVHVHKCMKLAATRLGKREGLHTHITPRHYIDFINHFVKLNAEKRSDLEEQQRHLGVGLQKIHDTVDQVDKMRADLAIKKTVLDQKNVEADEKLAKMMEGKSQAQEQQQMSEQIASELKDKQVAATEKRAIVQAELDQVQPAVEEAKAAVKGIKKSNLTELRALRNPPPVVKMVLESVSYMLGNSGQFAGREAEVVKSASSGDWGAIKQFVGRDDFISMVMNFDTDALGEKTKNHVNKKYIEHEDYNFERANKASKACGPLVQWARAQMMYATMLLKVEPLTDELKELDGALAVGQAKQAEISMMIGELEHKIKGYEDEYRVLIGEAEKIKAELKTVEEKCDRSCRRTWCTT